MDSIILGTSDDIFLDIWDCLNIVKNLKGLAHTKIF